MASVRRYAAATAIVGVIAVSLIAAAQARQSISSDVAGVLVGIAHSDPDIFHIPPDPTTLRTMWIPLKTGASLQASDIVDVPELLVPRSSGFWRVGRLSTCAVGPVDPDEKDRLAALISEYFWAVPLGRQPRVTLMPDDTIAPGPERVGQCHAASAAVFFCTNSRYAEIHWIAPDFGSVNLGIEGGCGAHPDGTPDEGVRRLEDIKTKIAIGGALGDAAEASLRAAYDREHAEYVKGMDRETKEACDTKFDPAAWWIGRAHGVWTTHGEARQDRGCNYGFSFEADIDVSRITGRQDDRAAWSQLHDRFPDLADAFSLSGLPWVIARRPDALAIFSTNTPAPVFMSSLGKSDRIVMVEWATGRNVARWDAEARRARTAPIDPIVVR